MGEKSASYHGEADAGKEQFPYTTDIWMSSLNWHTSIPSTVLGSDFFCVNHTMTFPYLASLSPAPRPTLQLNTQGLFLSLSLSLRF